MNYIELINRFWSLQRENSFNPSEIALYFHLLNISNSLGWKNPFREGNISITASIGLSKPTIQRSREKLVKAGLIKFESGKVKRELTLYTILGERLGENNLPLNRPQSVPLSVPLTVPQSVPQNDTKPCHFNKHKLNETKQNYIYINGVGEIFNLFEFIQKEFRFQWENWQRLFVNASIEKTAEVFLLERSATTFNDTNHFRNAFTKKLKEVDFKNSKEKSSAKKESYERSKISNRPNPTEVKQHSDFGEL